MKIYLKNNKTHIQNHKTPINSNSSHFLITKNNIPELYNL